MIGEKHAQWAELSKAIWDHPETAYREVFACGQQVKLLRELGFQVTTPYCGIETAYRADYGEGTPAFAWVAEYDALPKLGHGCGHNLICTAAVAAAYAAKTLFEKHGLSGQSFRAEAFMGIMRWEVLNRLKASQPSRSSRIFIQMPDSSSRLQTAFLLFRTSWLRRR